MNDPTGYSHDAISLRGAGVVTVAQQKKGARFTLDSILLADFCRVKARDSILEPGAGTGIVSLLLAKKHPRCRITDVEVQPSLASLCQKNILQNELDDRILLLEGDFRSLKGKLAANSFDVIVANPPYTRAGSGRSNPDQERLGSRQERFGNLDAWLELERYLRNKGRYALVFPARRLADLIASLRRHRLEPKRMRLVHPYEDTPASLVLIEAVKSGGTELQVLPPLVMHDTAGGYSREMKELYGYP